MHKTPALFEVFRVLHYIQAYTHSKSWSPNIFIFLTIEVQYFPDKLMSEQILKPIKQRARRGALRRYNLWGAGGRLGQKESYSSWAEGGRRLQQGSPTLPVRNLLPCSGSALPGPAHCLQHRPAHFAAKAQAETLLTCFSPCGHQLNMHIKNAEELILWSLI